MNIRNRSTQLCSINKISFTTGCIRLFGSLSKIVWYPERNSVLLLSVLSLDLCSTRVRNTIDANSDGNEQTADRTRLGVIRVNLRGAGTSCLQAQQWSVAATSLRCRYEIAYLHCSHALYCIYCASAPSLHRESTYSLMYVYTVRAYSVYGGPYY